MRMLRYNFLRFMGWSVVSTSTWHDEFKFDYTDVLLKKGRRRKKIFIPGRWDEEDLS